MVWLELKVMDGPQAIMDKQSYLRLMGHVEGDPDILQSEWWAQRAIGRMDIFEMFGQFDGLDKISKKHIIICETNYFPSPDGFTVSDLGSTNGTSFPNNGKDTGMEVEVQLGGVLTLSISYMKHHAHWPGYIIPASYQGNKEIWYADGQLRSIGKYEQFVSCHGRGGGYAMIADDHETWCDGAECNALFDGEGGFHPQPIRKTGEWYYFYKEGNVQYVGNYAVTSYREMPTVKHGLWTLYGKNRLKLAEVVFDKGEQKHITMYDCDGEKIDHKELHPYHI
jgi:hypothetical protein